MSVLLLSTEFCRLELENHDTRRHVCLSGVIKKNFPLSLEYLGDKNTIGIERGNFLVISKGYLPCAPTLQGSSYAPSPTRTQSQ